MRKLGAKNIEAGVGCGVGFGHGFGVGMSCYTLMGENLLYIISVIYMGSTEIIKPKEQSTGCFHCKGRYTIHGANVLYISKYKLLQST